MKDFRYTAKFESEARFSLNKWREVKASNDLFASSSLDDLRGLLPSDEEIEDNPDLLYTAMNAAVVNLVNANDHGIGTEAALSVSKYFKNKHMNVEHDKYDIVGHIISQGYSTFGTNKAITAEELKGTTDPFNITLGSVVYRYARQWFAEILEESSDSKSDLFKIISGSWEIAFNDFDIAVGSKKIADAEIITDESQIKELSQHLRMEGGSGFMPDGSPVYTIIKGDARPTGCAFTSNPAAAVKGLMQASASEGKDNSSEQILIQVRDEQKQVAASIKSLSEKIEESSSQEPKINVTKTSMKKIEKIEDITPDFLKEAEASTYVRDFITNTIAEKSKEYMQELETKEQSAKTAEDAKASAETAQKTAEDKVAQLEATVAKLEKTVEDKEKEEAFAARMEDIEAKFELSDEQRKVIAEDIKDLDDEAYSKYESKISVFASKKSEKPEKPEKDDNASKEDDATNLKNLKEDKGSDVPNSLSTEDSEPSFAEEAQQTLSSVIKIKTQ